MLGAERAQNESKIARTGGDGGQERQQWRRKVKLRHGNRDEMGIEKIREMGVRKLQQVKIEGIA